MKVAPAPAVQQKGHLSLGLSRDPSASTGHLYTQVMMRKIFVSFTHSLNHLEKGLGVGVGKVDKV